MNRQRQLVLALAALVIVVAAAFGLSFTGRKKEPPSANKVELASNGMTPDQACASAATYARLKEVAFEEALKVRNADPANLDTLATHSVVRMENPVVKSRDEDLNITVCSGTFVLELPPGAERGFGGQRRLTAEIEYAAQAAADGSGLVYQLNGAEPIIYRLATFDLQGQRYVPPQAPPETRFAEAAPAPDLPAPVPGGMGGPEESEDPAAVAAAEARAERIEQAQREARAARVRQAETRARAERAQRAERQRETRERTERAEARPARGNSRPSFNCRNARTRSERMVCDSGRLAASDREMSSMFYSALSDADPGTRRELRRTRDRFLAYRERCRSEECVADAYEGRMREIRDIVGEGE
ncbi:MAG TPA: hypothetical protein VGD19_00575 [Allosphingosinicella sp.]